MRFDSELINEIISKISIETGDEIPFENSEYDFGITGEKYQIKNDIESVRYGREVGTYEILSLPDVIVLSTKQINYISDTVADIISSFLGKLTKSSRVLVVGLGNRHISSDSLGSKVCHDINITFGLRGYPKVMAVCPSVLGLTGIESFEIINGVVERVKPTHIILVDSLCATIKVVLSFVRFLVASCICFSDMVSSAEVASSKIKILGFLTNALAIEIRCL